MAVYMGTPASSQTKNTQIMYIIAKMFAYILYKLCNYIIYNY